MRKVSANSALYWWILERNLMSPNWHWINFPPLVHFKSYCSLVQFSLILGPDYSCPGSFHAHRDKLGVVSSLFSSLLPYGSPAVTSLTKLRICLSSFFANHNSLLNLMCIFSSWNKGLTSTTGAQSFCFSGVHRHDKIDEKESAPRLRWEVWQSAGCLCICCLSRVTLIRPHFWLFF